MSWSLFHRSARFWLQRRTISLEWLKKQVSGPCFGDAKQVSTIKERTALLRRTSTYCGTVGSASWRSVMVKAAGNAHTEHPPVSLSDAVTGPLDGYKDDAHALGQNPLTFPRQVLAICTYPELLNHPRLPKDAKDRARKILQHCDGGSIGSYSDSKGNDYVKNSVAKYLEKRDGVIPSDPNKIYLMGGATEVSTNVLKVFAGGEGLAQTGVLVPVPCYHLYLHATDALNVVRVDYHLREDQGWSLNVKELRRALQEARKHCTPRLLCIINPGNPTGQVQSQQCIEEVIKFAAEERLVLLADEVFQDVVHMPHCQFHSVKKVLFGLGPDYCNTVELLSVHSISKSYMGESGIRGGYMEMVNIDPKAEERWYSMLSTHSCAPLTAQIILDVIADPPQPGDPSYHTFQKEKMAVLWTMSENARLTEEMLNTLPKIRCPPIQAASYAYPRIEIPDKVVKLAKTQGVEPDLFYCMKLMNGTGISVKPGSCFGQREGTYHFRLTIPLEKEKLKTLLNKVKEFHQKFLQDYS